MRAEAPRRKGVPAQEARRTAAWDKEEDQVTAAEDRARRGSGCRSMLSWLPRKGEALEDQAWSLEDRVATVAQVPFYAKGVSFGHQNVFLRSRIICY